MKLTWRTEQRKVSDLKKSEINPRKISDEQKKALIASLDKFDLVDIPVLNSQNEVISGNQRINALLIAGRGEELIDCRVPNRTLSKKEEKEYMLIANTHAGYFDAELIEVNFHDIGIEFEFKTVKETKQRNVKLEDISLFKDKEQIKMTFTKDTALKVKEALNKLKITPESIILLHLFGE